jgi:hypothetical protein
MEISKQSKQRPSRMFYNIKNTDSMVKGNNLEDSILLEIEIIYREDENKEILRDSEIDDMSSNYYEEYKQNTPLDLHTYTAKLYIPKNKVEGSFVQEELQKTGGNYIKVKF